MKNTRNGFRHSIRLSILAILCLALMLPMMAISPLSVRADEETDEPVETVGIALNPGFYCLHPHKKTPTHYDPVDMTPVPSTDYTGYTEDTLKQVAAAVLLRGEYKQITGDTVDDGSLQSVIWAIVCKRDACIMTNNNNENLHLNGRPLAKAYYQYVMDHYHDVEGKYTMTIWKSLDDEYQDILEAKLVEKFSVPTVEKKVMDRNDSASADYDSDGWQDSADYDIGDRIPFQITASLSDMPMYNVNDGYLVEFIDTMQHLTFIPDTICVTIDGVEKTDKFTVDWDPVKKELHIKCLDVLAIGAVDNSTIVVNYQATLDEDAKVGSVGNSNEVKLRYSTSDGYGITLADKVTVFTFKFIVNKVDENQQPLKGAAFELFKYSAEKGDYVSLGVQGAVKNVNGGYTPSGNETTFTWNGIDDGQYKLMEVVTPRGYTTMEPIEFKFSAFHQRLSEAPELFQCLCNYQFGNLEEFNVYGLIMSDLEAGKISFDWDSGCYTDKEGNIIDIEVYYEKYFNQYEVPVTTGTVEAKIENKIGILLPRTGGTGTTVIYTAGILMMVSAVAALLWKKRQV